MSLKALWKPLSIKGGNESLSRSSHGLVSIRNGEQVLIFGGELKPRTPVNGDLLYLNHLDIASPEISTLSPSSDDDDNSKEWPASRVGASLVSTDQGKVYLWGGRGGKEMGTFTQEKGIWEFDPSLKRWKELETKGDNPEPRSFHTMCQVDNKLYLHAGCPASGRLGQLHSLDLENFTWFRLPDAPEPGRGGTVLTRLPPTLSNKTLLARFGGFAGYELDGLDVYDVEKREWKSIEVEGEIKPEKRSVHVFVGLDGKLEFEGKIVVGVLALGEREGAPAELGHNGAGFFHNDAWALLASKDSEPRPRFTWTKLETSLESRGIPEPRGWLPAAHLSGSKVVFQGGLNEKNERLSDAWTLEVVVE
ncbi:hypothetical protein JCM5350_002744 [Sporobolomyces pararoseus]